MRYTEEQLIGFLRDGGIPVKDLRRKHEFWSCAASVDGGMGGQRSGVSSFPTPRKNGLPVRRNFIGVMSSEGVAVPQEVDGLGYSNLGKAQRKR